MIDMEKPNITEGEWHATGLEIRSLSSMILANIYNHIEGNQSKEEAKANAKAISAVPEMIDALLELSFLNQCELEGLSSGQPTPEQWRKAFEKAEQALKKAGVDL